MKNEVAVSFKEPIIVENKNQSSVEIKRNTKGNTEFIVKVYNENPEKAVTKANSLFISLSKKHKFEGK